MTFKSLAGNLSLCFGFASPLPDEQMFVCIRPAMPKNKKNKSQIGCMGLRDERNLHYLRENAKSGFFGQC
jgi:hypothetical protein